MDTNILLESGTNELEVLEFKVGKNFYGINVAKIREILLYQQVTPLPNAHPCIEGIFMPRDIMISVISLRKCLNITDEAPNDGLFIITNFNSLNTAFHVDEVLGIHRVSWEDIIKPDATISSDESGVSTGVIKLEDRLVVILDFEKIVTDINPETGLKVSEMDDYETRDRSKSPIMLAEDSPLLSKLITECLRKAGYTNLIVNPNGQEAWDILCDAKKKGVLHEVCKCLITDIEMPKMDGLRLTRLVKEDPEFSKIPVVIFSSLISEEMRRKGESIGANAMLSKPEIGNLVKEVDALVK